MAQKRLDGQDGGPLDELRPDVRLAVERLLRDPVPRDVTNRALEAARRVEISSAKAEARADPVAPSGGLARAGRGRVDRAGGRAGLVESGRIARPTRGHQVAGSAGSGCARGAGGQPSAKHVGLLPGGAAIG